MFHGPWLIVSSMLQQLKLLTGLFTAAAKTPSWFMTLHKEAIPRLQGMDSQAACTQFIGWLKSWIKQKGEAAYNIMLLLKKKLKQTRVKNSSIKLPSFVHSSSRKHKSIVTRTVIKLQLLSIAVMSPQLDCQLQAQPVLIVQKLHMIQIDSKFQGFGTAIQKNLTKVAATLAIIVIEDGDGWVSTSSTTPILVSALTSSSNNKVEHNKSKLIKCEGKTPQDSTMKFLKWSNGLGHRCLSYLKLMAQATCLQGRQTTGASMAGTSCSHDKLAKNLWWTNCPYCHKKRSMMVNSTGQHNLVYKINARSPRIHIQLKKKLTKNRYQVEQELQQVSQSHGAQGMLHCQASISAGAESYLKKASAKGDQTPSFQRANAQDQNGDTKWLIQAIHKQSKKPPH